MENCLQDRLTQFNIKNSMYNKSDKWIENSLNRDTESSYFVGSITSNTENKEYIYQSFAKKNDLDTNQISSQSNFFDKSLNEKETVNEGFIAKEQIYNITFSTKPDYINQITNMIVKDEFEDGVISESERFVKNVIEQEGIEKVRTFLMDIYYHNFSKPHILCGIMNIISNIDYLDMVPEGPIMAVALLQYKDLAVRDDAIKAFENWNRKESITVLEQLRFDEKWMQDYVDKVIKYLKEEGE